MLESSAIVLESAQHNWHCRSSSTPPPGLSTRCRGLYRLVATPAILCSKEPARASKAPYAGSLWHNGCMFNCNRSFRESKPIILLS